MEGVSFLSHSIYLLRLNSVGKLVSVLCYDEIKTYKGQSSAQSSCVHKVREGPHHLVYCTQPYLVFIQEVVLRT